MAHRLKRSSARKATNTKKQLDNVHYWSRVEVVHWHQSSDHQREGTMKIEIGTGTKWQAFYMVTEILKRFKNGKIAVRVNMKGKQKVFHVTQADLDRAI